uniref:WW domain-containing protein n=1 Tax=Guillardia theta TaxID=55529 RepID=A0A7S4JSW7_GUITH|mmetsp:Transcript_18488/g.60678  ORF Transcript_18488/g.60678 Transcript_18488/m.60678 type:complete len:252 (+) Transcript_18488:47-802(+)
MAAPTKSAKIRMASQTRMSLFQDCGRRVIAGFLGATTFVLPATADAFTAPSYAAQYLISVDTTLPNGWATASTSDGKVYYYNVDTKQTQWEKPTDTKLSAADSDKRREKQIKRENNLNEVVSFDFNPTIPVDRVTVREQPKLEGGCGETDYRSNSVECGAPAKIPVQDVAEKSISTIEGLAKGDVKQKAQAANERLRMLEAAEMKALSKSELFQKLESRTKDPARMAERKKQIDEITQKNVVDCGMRFRLT